MPLYNIAFDTKQGAGISLQVVGATLDVAVARARTIAHEHGYDTLPGSVCQRAGHDEDFATMFGAFIHWDH